jgi:hypothetical protein
MHNKARAIAKTVLRAEKPLSLRPELLNRVHKITEKSPSAQGLGSGRGHMATAAVTV